MNRIRLVVSLVLAAVVVAIGALAVFPPKEFVKSRVAAEVKAATGRELAIKGATSLRLLPSFALRVENVELQNAPGAAGAPLFAAHAVLIESSLWAIVSGSNVLDRVNVEGPRVALATDAKGQPNWVMPAGGGPSGGGPGIVVRSVTFAGGEVTFRDGASTEVLSMRGVDGTIRDYAGANIGQIEIDAGEANVRAGPGGPQLTIAMVDAEAKAIVAGVAGEVIFKAASAVYRQGAGGQPVKLEAPQLTAKSVSAASAIDAAVAVVWNGDRIAGDVRLPAFAQLLEGKASPVRVKIAAPKGNIDIDGALALAGGAAKIEGKANAAAASLRELAAWAGVELPKTGAFGAARAEGNVKLDGNRIALDAVQIALDAVKASGTLAVDLSGARPVISGRLMADALDVDSYLEAAPKPAPAKKPRTRDIALESVPAPVAPTAVDKEALKTALRAQLEALSAPPPAAPEETPATGPALESTRALAVPSSAWPDDPIDLSALKAIDADLILSVAKLTIKDLEIGVPDLKAVLKEGTLALDAKNLLMEGAKITGTATINVREALPKLAAKFKAQGVDPQAWFELFGQEARFIGKSAVEAELTGTGNSLRKVVDTLSGRVKATTSKGAIVGYDLYSVSGMFGLLLGQVNASWRTPFDELEAELALTNGIARKSSVEVTGQIFDANGSGVVKVPSQEIDYRVKLNLQSWGYSAAARILGGWAQPKVVDYNLSASSSRSLFPPNALEAVKGDPLEPLAGADLKDPELARLVGELLKKGSLPPRAAEVLEALKARAEGK